MRPCYQCRRFVPEAKAIDWRTGKPYPDAIGGCMGKGEQHDPDITAKDLGLSCDIFWPKYGKDGKEAESHAEA